MRRVLRIGAVVVLLLALTGCTSARSADPSATPVIQTPPGGVRAVLDPLNQIVTIEPQGTVRGVVVFAHAATGTQYVLTNGSAEMAVFAQLAREGFAVTASAGAGDSWGSPPGVNATVSAATAAMTAFKTRHVYVVGESMGGLVAMQAAARLHARAIALWFPVCDLRTVQKEFSGSIATAWGTSSQAAVSPVAVPEIPLIAWASDADTVVPASTNARYCYSTARAEGVVATYEASVGNHGDASNFDSSAVTQFFEAH